MRGQGRFVRPFVTALRAEGLSVWYDEKELKIGDSLRRSIDNGLKNSKYGIVVLSENFFKKQWTQKELDGLFAKEINGGNIILPIWHKISKNEVLAYSPMIADLKALNTSAFSYEELAKDISSVILK
ncbi:MAG: toll/interleukin-1 receptor domain-containing protein [Chitinophagaceae bacterium]